MIGRLGWLSSNSRTITTTGCAAASQVPRDGDSQPRRYEISILIGPCTQHEAEEAMADAHDTVATLGRLGPLYCHRRTRFAQVVIARDGDSR